MKKQQNKKNVSLCGVTDFITESFNDDDSSNEFNNIDCDLDDSEYDEFMKFAHSNSNSIKCQKHIETSQSNKSDIECNDDSDDSINEQSISKSSSHASTQSQSRPETNFFYTSDKFINSFEDDEIIEYIQQKYPMFKDVESDDTMTRKTIIDMLNDSKFMTKLLSYYNMTIFDFIKFLFRQESSLFKGQFIKRISKSLKRKKYVVQDKKQAFRYSPKRKRKVRRTRR